MSPSDFATGKREFPVTCSGPKTNAAVPTLHVQGDDPRDFVLFLQEAVCSHLSLKLIECAEFASSFIYRPPVLVLQVPLMSPRPTSNRWKPPVLLMYNMFKHYI
jgi:hypothetical protein